MPRGEIQANACQEPIARKLPSYWTLMNTNKTFLFIKIERSFSLSQLPLTSGCFDFDFQNNILNIAHDVTFLVFDWSKKASEWLTDWRISQALAGTHFTVGSKIWGRDLKFVRGGVDKLKLHGTTIQTKFITFFAIMNSGSFLYLLLLLITWLFTWLLYWWVTRETSLAYKVSLLVQSFDLSTCYCYGGVSCKIFYLDQR